jgi:hypothetical protein
VQLAPINTLVRSGAEPATVRIEGLVLAGDIRATPKTSLFLLAKFEGLALRKSRKLQNSIE